MKELKVKEGKVQSKHQVIKKSSHLKTLGENALKSYRRQFSKSNYKAMEIYQKEYSLSLKRINDKLDQLESTREQMNTRLQAIENRAIESINHHILEQALLIPLFNEDAKVFDTDTLQIDALEKDNLKNILFVERDKDVAQHRFKDRTNNTWTYLKSFPSTIENEELRTLVQSLYLEWDKFKSKFQYVEDELKKQRDSLDLEMKTMLTNHNQFLRLAKPIEIQIADIQDKLPKLEEEKDRLNKEVKEIQTEIQQINQYKRYFNEFSELITFN